MTKIYLSNQYLFSLRLSFNLILSDRFKKEAVFSGNQAVIGGAIANQQNWVYDGYSSTKIGLIDGYTFKNNSAISNQNAFGLSNGNVDELSHLIFIRFPRNCLFAGGFSTCFSVFKRIA